MIIIKLKYRNLILDSEYLQDYLKEMPTVEEFEQECERVAQRRRHVGAYIPGEPAEINAYLAGEMFEEAELRQ